MSRKVGGAAETLDGSRSEPRVHAVLDWAAGAKRDLDSGFVVPAAFGVHG